MIFPADWGANRSKRSSRSNRSNRLKLGVSRKCTKRLRDKPFKSSNRLENRTTGTEFAEHEEIFLMKRLSSARGATLKGVSAVNFLNFSRLERLQSLKRLERDRRYPESF
jgi:hypothetical protein